MNFSSNFEPLPLVTQNVPSSTSREIAVSLLGEVPHRNRTRAEHVVAAAFMAGAVIVPSLEVVVYVVQWVRYGEIPSAYRVGDLSVVFAPFLGIAAVTLVAPTHLLAMELLAPHLPRLARVVYLAPTFIVASIPLIIFSSDLKNSSPFFDTEAVALTLAIAAPAALVFYLAVNRKSQPRGGWLLAVLALIWLAALIAALFGVPSTQRVDSSPLATRDHIIVAWKTVGLIAMFAVGLTAYVVWHLQLPRMTAALLVAGIGAPFAFIGWYFAVPLGDGYAHFSLGTRTVLIDWRRQPYQYDGGLNFKIDDLELYRIAGRHALNKTLRVQPAVGSLHDKQRIGELPDVSREQWGLTCYDVNFHGRPVAVCGQPGLAENWTTWVWVEKSHAFHSFDRDGVRYGLHYDADDVENWRDIERAAIDALEVADMSRK